MRLRDLITLAKHQQQFIGKDDADVSFVIPGSWPRSGRKRLFGRHGGPLGRCIAEHEDSVLCVFAANEVIAAAEHHLAALETLGIEI